MSKLRKSARGQSCTLRLTNTCSHNTETVVLCHIRDFGGGGTSLKPPDRRAVYACSRCHDALDGRGPKPPDWPESRYEDLLRALMETHDRMTELGLMECA
jgi:hypothetical protein